VLELAEEAFDEIALAVNAPVDRAVHKALAGRGYVGFGAAGSDQVEQRIGVVATVGDDVSAFEASKQERCGAQVVVLSGGQYEPHW
jgi:hypothetical protein